MFFACGAPFDLIPRFFFACGAPFDLLPIFSSRAARHSTYSQFFLRLRRAIRLPPKFVLRLRRDIRLTPQFFLCPRRAILLSQELGGRTEHNFKDRWPPDASPSGGHRPFGHLLPGVAVVLGGSDRGGLPRMVLWV